MYLLKFLRKVMAKFLTWIVLKFWTMNPNILSGNRHPSHENIWNIEETYLKFNISFRDGKTFIYSATIQLCNFSLCNIIFVFTPVISLWLNVCKKKIIYNYFNQQPVCLSIRSSVYHKKNFTESKNVVTKSFHTVRSKWNRTLAILWSKMAFF